MASSSSSPDLTHCTWLVTGGCGFIGSEFIRKSLLRYHDLHIVNIDSLSYAASPERLVSVTSGAAAPRYHFIRGDISNPQDVQNAIALCSSTPTKACAALINFAAESHVDRSLFTGVPFVQANTMGVQVLLEAAKAHNIGRFVQVSTDEVYGDVEAPHRSVETDPIHTSSPYSASKAGGELLVQAFVRSFKFPAIITRCSNNYGPWHWPEKMIPLFIVNLLSGKTVPVYGDGQQRRDWIHVEDHANGILHALLHGKDGEIYNFDGEIEIDNLALTRKLIALAGRDESAIKYVPDRPGHDRRYALDSAKSHRELGWKPHWTLDQGLEQTFQWYLDNKGWWQAVTNENYRAFYEKQYETRK
jgi:dTDP-glucose 4,6-dehydratase